MHNKDYNQTKGETRKMSEKSRKLKIAIGENVKSSDIRHIDSTWYEFKRDYLNKPVRITTTRQAWRELSKEEKTELKKIGYFIGGEFENDKRSNANFKSRSLLTIDIDDGDESTIENIADNLKEWTYFIHSTISHDPAQGQWHYRLVMPLKRNVNSIEYQLLYAKIASLVGANQFDECSKKPAQPMFFPAYLEDEIIEIIDNDLENTRYLSIDDFKERVDGAVVPLDEFERLALHDVYKGSAPSEKPGFVGAFNREFSIDDVLKMKAFKSEYILESDGNYTYLNASSGGKSGVKIYDREDDRRAIFCSFHKSDSLCYANVGVLNAYDLLRVKLFGHLDKDGPKGKNIESKQAMNAFIKKRFPQLIGNITTEANAKNRKIADIISTLPYDFDHIEDIIRMTNDTGESVFELDKNCEIIPSWMNLLTILSHDIYLKDTVRFNEFSKAIDLVGDLFGIKGGVNYQDMHERIFAEYLTIGYGLKVVNASSSGGVLRAAINRYSEVRKYHPVQKYLESLEWDGIPRAEKLWIDYCHEKDDIYTRETAIKFLLAAVSRAYDETKFDYVPILEGPQGVGKSTFFKVLAKDWFSEIYTFDNKEAAEILSGVWIAEIPELAGFSKKEINNLKQFFSATGARYRAAYAHNAGYQERQCVFAGTTNDQSYLRDRTGNRRFWPLLASTKIEIDKLKKDIDQIWAEAYKIYKSGDYTLYLSEEADKIACARQDGKMHVDPIESFIYAYLDYPQHERRYNDDYSHEMLKFRGDKSMYKVGDVEIDGYAIPTMCCVQEIIEYGVKPNINVNNYDNIHARIKGILENDPEWEKMERRIRFGKYGHLRSGFMRVYMGEEN